MKSTIQQCIKETDPENGEIKIIWVARLTDIFSDVVKVKEIDASEEISTYRSLLIIVDDSLN